MGLTCQILKEKVCVWGEGGRNPEQHIKVASPEAQRELLCFFLRRLKGDLALQEKPLLSSLGRVEEQGDSCPTSHQAAAALLTQLFVHAWIGWRRRAGEEKMRAGVSGWWSSTLSEKLPIRVTAMGAFENLTNTHIPFPRHSRCFSDPPNRG